MGRVILRRTPYGFRDRFLTLGRVEPYGLAGSAILDGSRGLESLL
jgi:hypothetical protein